jgi:WD40 repeat protein
VLFIVGLASLRFSPGSLNSSVFDKGVNWLPSEANADAAGYLGALVVLPLLSLPIAFLGAVAAKGRYRSLSAGGAVAGLVLAGVLCLPVEHDLFDGFDTTSFGGVGTTSVSFSADGRALLTANADQVSIVWILAGAGRPVRSATFSGGAAFSPHGHTLATRGSLWRLAGAAHPTRIASVADQGDPDAFSPDGRLLAIDSANGGDTGTVRDVSARTHPKRVGRFTGQWAAFSPDGQTFATSASCWWDSAANATGCGTTLWSVAGGSQPHPIANLGGGDAVFSPDGRAAATRAIGSTVVLWNLADPSRPKRVATLTSGSDDNPPSSVIFSPNGRFLAVGGDNGTVKLWSVADPTRVATLPPTRRFPNGNQIGASSTLTEAAFTRHGRALITVMGNDLVTVWNVSNPRLPIRTSTLSRQTQGAGVVAFSPDATTIAGAAVDGSNHVSLWQVAKGLHSQAREMPQPAYS